MSRRLVLLLACALAASGIVGVAMASQPETHPSVQLSAGTDEPSSSETTDAVVDTTIPEPTTTSTTSTTSTTTAAVHPTTTTTTAQVSPSTSTTAAPVTTTTAAPKTVVLESVQNNMTYAMYYGIGSINSGNWTLQPGQKVTPNLVIAIGGPNNDSSGSHAVSDPSCGRGDNDIYFTAGHHYRIEINPNSLPKSCGEGGHLDGYMPILFDLTAGTSRQIG